MRLMWADADLGAGPISTSITRDETAELQRLAANRKVLEIGSAYGYSAIAMALAGGHVTALDPHGALESRETMEDNLRRYGVADLVDVDARLSDEAMPEMVAQGRSFDLVFVDGNHIKASVEHDVTWALRLLPPGGILACHDYGEDKCPDVAVVLDRFFPNGPDRLVDSLFVVTP